MAKRYIKISPFYNRPSTAGPLSAERLNAINDGLEAVDTYKIDVDAIVNNGVTTVEGTVLDGRMGKTLQDQVTTINNNINARTLSNIKSGIFQFTDAASFSAALDEPLINLFELNYSDAVYPIDVILINSYGSVNNGGSAFQGGKYRMVGEVAATASGVYFGSVIIYGYFIPRTRCANNGAWSNWADIA